MARGRIVAVGPADTVLGLGLVGVEGTIVGSPREAAAALDAALAAPGVELVLLSEAWSRVLHARLEASAADESGPLIIEIPDPDAHAAHVPLLERVEELLGMRLQKA